MKISIIIPVYNTEKYLTECLDSLINQTYKDLELIIINDGSTDNSMNIIKKYQKKYDNIKVFEQENSGQSVARNVGLKYATGDYIMFVDSDDYIELDMVEKMLLPFKKSKNLDLTFCDYYLKNNDELVKDYIIKHNDISEKKALILSAPSPCLKVFKKSFLKNFSFPEHIIYEDLAAMPVLLTSANRIHHVKEHLYYYRQHGDSTTRNTKFNIKKMDILKASQVLLDRYKDTGNEEYKQEIDYLIIEHLVLMGGLRFARYPNPIEKLKQITKFVESNSINILDNYYYHNLSKIKKMLIKNILKNNIIECYLFFIKRKLKIGGYNEI